jgi:HK97 gp10 family phage protein
VTFSVWFEGVDELNSIGADMTGLGPVVQALALRTVTRTAHAIEADGKTFAPVDTGFLRNSITTDIEYGVGTATAHVGPTASYGAYVEFGTYRAAPHAYMGPALDRHSGEFEDAMADLVGRSLWH